jgi:hypothetical protein
LPFQQDVESHIGIMYLTTAVQTAAFAALVLTIDPSSPGPARLALAIVALGVMIANMPNRKGFTIAVNYLVDRPVKGPEDPPAS